MKIEATTRLKLTAAPVSSDVERKFIAELFKHANLKKLGMYPKAGEIRSQQPLSVDKTEDLISALKKAGFSKTWKPKGYSERALGLATPEGTWPIVVDFSVDESKEGLYYDVEITLELHDTLNKSETKRDAAAFKAVVVEVAKLLKVKALNPETHYQGTGYSVEVGRPNSIDPRQAATLMRAYGKPKQTSMGAGKYANQVLTFQKEYGELRLVFSSGTLYEIECKVN